MFYEGEGTVKKRLENIFLQINSVFYEGECTVKKRLENIDNNIIYI